MLLDPNAKRFLDMIAVGANADFRDLSPDDMRARFERLMGLMAPRHVPIGRVENDELPGPEGSLPVRIYTPLNGGGTRLPGLIYFHGGGCVFGSLDTHDALCRMLANASSCRLVSVAYRLAPEHPFPAAPADAYAVVSWIVAHAPKYGIDGRCIAVGGDSAGGGLAAGAALRIAHESGPRISLVLLLSPALDLFGDWPSRRAFARGYFLDQVMLDWTLRHYCPKLDDPSDFRLSPLRANDLSLHPPTLLHTAEFDPLRDEGHAYAERLKSAGVEVSYTCHAGMIHHFYGMGAAIPAARTTVEAIGQSVRLSLALSAGEREHEALPRLVVQHPGRG